MAHFSGDVLFQAPPFSMNILFTQNADEKMLLVHPYRWRKNWKVATTLRGGGAGRVYYEPCRIRSHRESARSPTKKWPWGIVERVHPSQQSASPLFWIWFHPSRSRLFHLVCPFFYSYFDFSLFDNRGWSLPYMMEHRRIPNIVAPKSGINEGIFDENMRILIIHQKFWRKPDDYRNEKRK